MPHRAVDTVEALRRRVTALMGSERMWLVLAAMLGRGVGFIASVVIGRLTGAASLGLYSAVVNTAGAVAQPAIGVLANASTLSAGAPGHTISLRRLLLTYLAWVALGMAGMALMMHAALSAAGLYAQAAQLAVPPASLFLVAGAVMLGTLLTATVGGLLGGVGEFMANARLASFTSLLLMALSVPVVAWGGLRGALALAGVTACLPALMLVVLAWHVGGRRRVGLAPGETAWRVSRSHLIASLPNALALVLTSVVSWLCTIYLTQRAHGMQGVAVVAVASQWLTIMLMPATSWGGMLIRELMAHHLPGSIQVEWGMVRRMIRRNLWVTGGVGIVVALGSSLIARLYHLEGTGLQVMLLIHVAVAMIMTVVAVPERVLVCQARQVVWLAATVVGLGTQLLLTWAFIDAGVWIVPLASLLAQVMVLLTLLGWLTFRAK